MAEFYHPSWNSMGELSSKAEVVGQGWVVYEETRVSGQNAFCLS